MVVRRLAKAKVAGSTPVFRSKRGNETMSEKQQNHIGAYVYRTFEAAFFTVLLADNTCGMFLMPSAQDVFWLGFTRYKISGDKLKFKIQNPGSDQLPSMKKDSAAANAGAKNTGAKPETLSKAQSAASEPDQYLDATLTPGEKYVQHGQKQETTFDFLTADIKFWQDLGWKKLGDARLLENMKDFDVVHEANKLCVVAMTKYDHKFIWA